MTWWEIYTKVYQTLACLLKGEIKTIFLRNESYFHVFRWMSSKDDAAVSIWPQSGEANLSQLHLSLLTDNDYHADNDTETSIECPPSLYWCRDTCYSSNICQKNTNDDDQLYQQIYGTDFNLISTMFDQNFMNQVCFCFIIHSTNWIEIYRMMW